MTGYGDGSNRVALSLSHTQTHNARYMGGGPWPAHIFTAGPHVPRLTWMPQSHFSSSIEINLLSFEHMLGLYGTSFYAFMILFVIVSRLTFNICIKKLSPCYK